MTGREEYNPSGGADVEGSSGQLGAWTFYHGRFWGQQFLNSLTLEGVSYLNLP
jgi:hypothetical protein